MDSIVEAVAYAAANKPNAVAVIAEGQQITYGELWKEVRGFAAYLSSFHFEKGARVVVKARHSIWYVVSCFGIHLAGLAHVPLEKTIGVEGLKDIARQLSASMVISDLELDGSAFVMVRSSSVRELAATHFSANRQFQFPETEEICDILFTTGTTGKSKGVMVSHRAQVALAENVQYGIELPENNVYLIPNPVNHAAGIRNIYLCMQTATTAVLLDGYSNVKLFFEHIRDYHVMSIYMPPAAVRMILLLASKEFIKYADQLHYIYTGSASFPEADKERMKKLFPSTHLYYAYGCSEAGRACIIDYSSLNSKENCVGRPTKNSRVFIVDENKQKIRSSETNLGLIAISGATVMNGYYNDPDLTAKTLQNGVVYTNDIGYFDEEGYLYIIGRKDDVINLGGLKIAPTEVENVVLRFPGVAECACFAVQDKISGVAPKLNIVEESGTDIDISALREHMLKYLEAFKVPKLVEKVQAIPKTANGKINRKVMK